MRTLLDQWEREANSRIDFLNYKIGPSEVKTMSVEDGDLRILKLISAIRIMEEALKECRSYGGKFRGNYWSEIADDALTEAAKVLGEKE